MGNRGIDLEPNAICDGCGKKGAFDFMGDYFCPECLNSKEAGDDDTIEDGFGMECSAWCPECGEKTMSIVPLLKYNALIADRRNMIKSFEQYKETYFPLRTEADKVKKMSGKGYANWWLDTPKEHRDKILRIIDNDKGIANA